MIADLADVTRLFGALVPFARFLAGPPSIDATAVALYRALSRRSWSGAPEAVTEAARADVAVLTSGLVPPLAPFLAVEVQRRRRGDALLELGLAVAARNLDGVATVALLKGSAAIAWVYPESAWRSRRDLDLLVGDALPEVRRALIANGWRDANDPRHGHDPTNVRAWNMAVEIGGGTVHLDLHRQLVHSRWCRPDIPLMLASRVEGRGPLPVTCPADTMVNTAIHLLGTGFHEPLKGWIDLLRLLPLVSPAELAQRARAHHLVTGMWTCLGVLERWFEAPVESHRAALGRPGQAWLLDHLTAGEHATPERTTPATRASRPALSSRARDADAVRRVGPGGRLVSSVAAQLAAGPVTRPRATRFDNGGAARLACARGRRPSHGRARTGDGRWQQPC